MHELSPTLSVYTNIPELDPSSRRVHAVVNQVRHLLVRLYRWSWIEAVGFAFLLAGTIIYAAGSQVSWQSCRLAAPLWCCTYADVCPRLPPCLQPFLLQNAEEAVEKAVLTAVEAQLGGTASCTPQGTSPRQTGTGAISPMISEAQQQMPAPDPGSIPGQSIRRVLVRKVSGLNSLLESEGVQVFYSGDTPLGTSPDMEQGAAFASFSGTSPGADGSLQRTVRLEFLWRALL